MLGAGRCTSACVSAASSGDTSILAEGARAPKQAYLHIKVNASTCLSAVRHVADVLACTGSCEQLAHSQMRVRARICTHAH
eukprot:12657776-Alexandrium_andersonii.AAC.1